jgi:hypothetical protein
MNHEIHREKKKEILQTMRERKYEALGNYQQKHRPSQATHPNTSAPARTKKGSNPREASDREQP